MNLSVTKHPIGISELAYSTVTEQPVECDVMLPDYCPDIVKVLSCDTVATLTDTIYQGGRITLEGVVKLTVFYLSGEGGVRKTDYKLPYSKIVDCKAVDGQPIITASTEVAYINCRAVSPRRLDIRGAVSIAVKMWVDKEEETIQHAEGEDICLKKKEVETCSVIGRMHTMLIQREDLEVPAGKAAPVQVVKATGAATVTECRAIGGRAVLKGELALRICYATDDMCRRFETAEYLLPISQIVDAPAAKEGADADGFLSVCCVEVEVTEDPSGATIFEAEVEMLAKLCFSECRTVTIATDCYSTRFPCEARVRKVPMAASGQRVSEKRSLTTEVDVGEDITDIAQVWLRPEKPECRPTEEGSMASGKIVVCLLGYVGEEIDYREHKVDYEVPMPLKVGPDFVPDVGLSLPAATLTATGSMELKVEVAVSGMAIDGAHMDALVDIELDESAPFEIDPAVGVRIYYADPGERVWDIAKRYHTSEAMIIQDNGLEADYLAERRALIIPSV